MRREFHCRVVTPEGVKFDRPVVSAIFPTYDGLVGVLVGHAPLISVIDKGTLSLRTADDSAYFLDLSDGFVEVRDNLLTILANKTGELLRRDKLSPNQMLLDARSELIEKQQEEARGLGNSS